jgi:hypothetical protein
LRNDRNRLLQAEERARNYHDNWQGAMGRLEAAREELGRYRRLWEEARELAGAQSRQFDALQGEVVHLRARLLRFDLHPFLGPILSGRRRVKGVLNGLRGREDGC